jgi:hypothetical protein
MKAERRHELAENELAKVIKGAPTFWQQSGGKFLLGLIVVLLIIILIQYRMRANREGVTQATEQLALARGYVDQLQNDAAQMAWMFGPPNEVIQRRKLALSEANSAIDSALRLSDDRRVEAEAMLARGDLNWSAAALPPVPAAATQPALQMKPSKEYLATAAEAYQTVTNNYSDVTHADIAARFGLGAIHEQRGEWDQAKQIYAKIAADTSNLAAYKQLAEARMTAVDMLRNPVIVGKPATEPAMPESMNPFPSSTRPIPPTIAAPGAATQPAGPRPQATTLPTTAPAPASTPTPAPARP